MGKSTTLYAVSIDEVRAAVGSGDDAILNRMCEFVASFLADDDEDEESEDMSAEHSIFISDEGKITYQETERTLDQICAEIIRIPSGTVEFVISPPWNEQHDAAIRAMNEVIPRSGLDRVLTRFETDDPSVDTSPNVTWTRADGATDSGGSLKFGVSPEIMSALVSGSVAQGEPENIRAFEILCYVLGMKLPDDDHLGDLGSLDLETQLLKERFPVELKVDASDSGVSFLTSEEVLAEALKFSKMDLSYPDCEDIQEARNTLMKCLKQAAIEGAGVVSFTQ